MMKKVFISLAVIIVAVVLLLFTNSSSTRTYESYLNVLNWTSYIPSEVVADFEEEYQIKVNYGTYSSNEELLAKVSTAKPGTYDVIFPSDYMVSLLKEREMLEPLDITKLSNFHNLDPRFLKQPYDPDNTYSLPFLLATSVIAYNSGIVSEIYSYQDLLNPEFKNNLVLLDDSRIMIGAFLNAAGYPMNDVEPAHLEKALEFYRKLRPNVKAFDSDSPKTFFITDEVIAGIVWNAEATLARENNPAIKMAYPEEGFSLSMDNYTIVKDARNLENAYKFIDFLLSDEIAAKIVAEYPYISTNRQALNLSETELNTILERGSYVENVGIEGTKRLDRIWAKIK